MKYPVNRRTERPAPADGRRRSEATQEAIKRYILDHRLRAGDLLPTEGQLAAALGVGRSSLREAVKALEALGVLETRRGVGSIVRPFSFDPILDNLAYGLLFDRSSVAELLLVRKQVEAGLVEQVAGSITKAQLRMLRRLVDAMGERAAADESQTAEDRLFHRALYAGTGLHLALKLLDVFWEVYWRLRDEALRLEAVDPMRNWESHRRILGALERGDGPAARAAMVEHFAGIEARVARASVQGV